MNSIKSRVGLRLRTTAVYGGKPIASVQRAAEKGEKNMPKLTFVIGTAATGKSFFIQQKYAGQGIEILDVYDYQQRVYDEAGVKNHIPYDLQFRCLMKANLLLLDDILATLKNGRDVVVEHTLFKAKRRIAYLDEVRKIPNVTAEVYVMQPGDARWRSYLEKRKPGGSFQGYKNTAEQIEFPNAAEGFERIFTVTGGEVRLRMDPPRPDLLEPARAELAKEAEELRRKEEERKKREDLLESMKERRFWHYCEVCGKKAFLTAQEAFDSGWDYPPHTGPFGLLGPRTCGKCQLKDTLFWKINTDGKLPIVCEGDLSPEELVTWRRIRSEPESLLSEEETSSL